MKTYKAGLTSFTIIMTMLAIQGMAKAENISLKPTVLAHRGIHQRYNEVGVTNDTCTAKLVLPSTNNYLENTISSMKATFAAGADIIELDIHPTIDGNFAVFHDWTLDCRTNGHGVTREQTMAYLKSLDIGFGYTSDNGQTYPFRGKGVGMMPSLQEVLEAFPDKRFMLNIKSKDLDEIAKLANYLDRMKYQNTANLIIYARDAKITAESRRLIPTAKAVSMATAKECLESIVKDGIDKSIPETCKQTLMFVPVNYTKALKGWPSDFIKKMQSVNTEVFLLGAMKPSDNAIGIDTIDELKSLPNGYSGGIYTNAIEVVGPEIKMLH